MTRSDFESLVTTDAFVVNLLELESQTPMKKIRIESFTSFRRKGIKVKTLQKSVKIYRKADLSGLKIQPHRFEGFGLFNETG